MTTHSEAVLYLTHADPMIARARRLSGDMLQFSDDLAGLIVVLEAGKKIAQDVLEPPSKHPLSTLHPPSDAHLTDNEKRERNG